MNSGKKTKSSAQKWMDENPRTRPAPKSPEKGKLIPHLKSMREMKNCGRSLSEIVEFLGTIGVEATRAGVHLALGKAKEADMAKKLQDEYRESLDVRSTDPNKPPKDA